MRILFFILVQVWTAGIDSFEDLSKLFDRVTGYTSFTSNVNVEKTSNKIEHYNEKFDRLIDFLQHRRDDNLVKLKNHLYELKLTVEESLKTGINNENRPVWPTCCGRNGDLSVFTPELKISDKHLKSCQAPIDPSSKTNPVMSLYETPGCCCLMYSESSSVNDDAFSETVLDKIIELDERGIQQLIGTLNGITSFYPGSDNGQIWRPCDRYDNRRRPWTIQIMEKGSLKSNEGCLVS